MQATQNLMLHLEPRLHSKLGSFLDLEGVVFQSCEGAGGTEVDGDGIPVCGVHGEREDDAVAGIGRVREILAAAAETE